MGARRAKRLCCGATIGRSSLQLGEQSTQPELMQLKRAWQPGCVHNLRYAVPSYAFCVVLPSQLSTPVRACREHAALLLRPPHFKEHDIDFVVQYDKGDLALLPDSARLPYDCYRVPPHLRQRHWTQLLQRPAPSSLSYYTHGNHIALADRMLLPGDGCHLVWSVLAKFEDPAFIHVYELSEEEGGEEVAGRAADSSGGRGGGSSPKPLVFELPRHGLEFVLRGSQALSRDYAGYRMRGLQQLVWMASKQQQEQQQQQDQQQQQQPGQTVMSSMAGTSTSADKGGGNDGGGSVLNLVDVSYTLPEFRQYLVLERVPGGVLELGARREEVLVLVPAGEVDVFRDDGGSGSRSGSGWGCGRVRVKLSTYSGTKLQVSYGLQTCLTFVISMLALQLASSMARVECLRRAK